MKLITSNNNFYFLRFDRDEEVLVGIKKFCQKEKIFAGTFQIIGAAKEVLLSFYDLKKKVYTDLFIEEDVEITSILGNIAMLNGDIVVHAHGTVSNETFHSYGGHIKKLIISATGEVAIQMSPVPIDRKFDASTGLNLLT